MKKLIVSEPIHFIIKTLPPYLVTKLAISIALVTCCIITQSVRAQTQSLSSTEVQSELRNKFLSAFMRLEAENEASISAFDAKLAAVGLEKALRTETVTTEEGLHGNDERFAKASSILSLRQQHYATFLDKVESMAQVSVKGARNESEILQRIRNARKNDETLSQSIFDAEFALLESVKRMSEYLKGKLGRTYIIGNQLAFQFPEDQIEFLKLVAKYDQARNHEAYLIGYKDALHVRRQQGWQRIFDE